MVRIKIQIFAWERGFAVDSKGDGSRVFSCKLQVYEGDRSILFNFLGKLDVWINAINVCKESINLVTR